MQAVDMPPKMKQKPNKVKMDKDCPFTDHDEQLKHELKAFWEKIHAELWGNITNILFGPHIFLTEPQIFHLCHLAHANALHTLEDLENNFQWNWISDYGHALLELIHHVNTPEMSAPISVKDGIGQPDAEKLDNQVSSKSSRGGKERIKKGPGNQCCSACGTLGHNSKFCQQVSVSID